MSDNRSIETRTQNSSHFTLIVIDVVSNNPLNLIYHVHSRILSRIVYYCTIYGLHTIDGNNISVYYGTEYSLLYQSITTRNTLHFSTVLQESVSKIRYFVPRQKESSEELQM